MEIDRRKRVIDEIGARPPGNDTFASILWMAMDPSTRTNSSSKVATEDVQYPELREVAMRYTSIAVATSTKYGAAMDIGSIDEAKDRQEDTQWPTGEDGDWEDYDELLNYVGGGKGKCWNCGKEGHQSWACPEPPQKGKGKGLKGKGKGEQKGKGKGFAGNILIAGERDTRQRNAPIQKRVPRWALW